MTGLRGVLCGLALALATGAQASGVPAPAGGCDTVVQSLSKLGTVGATRSTPSGGCLFNDVTLAIGARQQFHADEIETGALNAAAFQPGRPVLEKLAELHVVARHASFRPKTQTPLLDFILAAQTRSLDIALDLKFDAARGELHLDRFLQTGPEYGTFRLSATLTGLHAADLGKPGAGPPTDAALSSVDIDLDNRGMFEAFALAPMAGFLLQGSDDPAKTFAEIKQRAAASSAKLLTEGGATPATVQAVSAFIASLPRPRGHFHFHADFPEPLTLGGLHARMRQGDNGAPLVGKGASLTASFTPPPPEPRIEP